MSTTLQDWAVLAIMLLGSALGAWVLADDWRMGTVMLVVFGSSALLCIDGLIGKLRATRARQLATRIRTGSSFYAERSRAAPVAAGCVIVGGMLCFLGIALPLFVRLLGALIAAFGVIKLMQICRGEYRSRFIRFEPGGLCISERYYLFRIEWDDVRAFELLGYLHDPEVMLRFGALERIEVHPSHQRTQLARDLADQRAWARSHLSVKPQLYGVDASAFIAAVAQHIAQARARSTG